MTLDFLPPQAYTKETLLKAYNWLQSQSDQVREMATTPDQLVSLFLKASRHGQETVERPSLQNFKSELKNLAGIMGDLEKKQSSQGQPQVPPQPPPAQPTLHYSQSQTPQQPSHYSQTIPAQPTPQAHIAYSHPTSQTVTASPAASPETVYQTAPAATSRTSNIDELTQSLIREVKNELNLSSDHEALRMLVKIGYQKVRSLYK